MIKDNAFKGKTIVVTGGGTGLAKAMSKYFSEFGGNVIISNRKIAVLKKLQLKFQLKPGMKYFLSNMGLYFPTFLVVEQIRGN